MIDILSRLEAVGAAPAPDFCELARDAAEEIKRLRAENVAFRRYQTDGADYFNKERALRMTGVDVGYDNDAH
jgi:hypothetical protein